MPDLCRIVDFIPLRWRYATVSAVPLLVGFAVYFFLDFGVLPIILGSVLAVLGVWFLGNRQSGFFLRTANGILRTQSIDRANRLETYGPHEQQRIINAVNRLADSVEAILGESARNRVYHETILNELTLGILVVDADGILQYANPAAGSTLNFTFDSQSALPAPLASKVNIYEINDAATKSAVDGEIVLRNVVLYDSQRHIEVISRALPPDESAISRAILIVSDRTEEIRLGVSMREFVANASHELRTPIASIKASVDTLKLGVSLEAETANQFLDRIDDSAQRMAALVSEMMDLTMLETGRSPMHVKMTDPSELIDAVLASHGPMGIVPVHHIEKEIIGEVPEVLVDQEKMERAIGNLLGNAQKFTPPAGNIRISCWREGDSVFIAVADNGEGIDPDELPHIFERFYKSRRSSGDRTGFGLGLAITKNIVEMHDGSVEVSSVMGDGSTFRVKLPIS